MRKIIDKVKKNIAFCQINDILNIYNESFTTPVYNLLINSLVLVY